MPHEDYCYALERENHALNEKYESLRQQVTLLREVVNRNIECIHFGDPWPVAESCIVFSREALAATEPKP